jgi:hypothetical protein
MMMMMRLTLMMVMMLFMLFSFRHLIIFQIRIIYTHVLLLMQAAVLISKQGSNFIGVIKTSHSLFPKDYLQLVLGPLPAGSRLALKAIVDGEDLFAIGYKYNRKKVLFLVTNSRVADLHDGEPYLQRWADDHGNLCSRAVQRPAVISRYFRDSPKVDNHNQARQHDLALEELWLTQD